MGVRTRRQLQLEEEEEEMVQQEDAGELVKKNHNADDIDLDLPSIDDINGWV